MTEIEPTIIDSPSEITPDWVSAVLKKQGHDVTVTHIESTPVGTGQMAHNERFVLTYEGDAGDAPASLVGKFPSPSEESRAAGAAGGYRNEVRFYLDVAPLVSTRTPRCWYGAVADDSATFTLLLEDLAPAEQGDQISGASVEQLDAAVRNLAGLHAPMRGNPVLDQLDWMVSAMADQTVEIVQLVTPMFTERYADRLSAEARQVVDVFAANVETWLDTQPEPSTVVHGDYRLDNLLFASAAGGDPVAVVDWQTVSVSSGGRDLAFLLGNSIDADARRTHEHRLLDAYHAAMVALGADGTRDDVEHDYRHGSFQGPFITMLGSIAVGRTDRGDDMFMAMAERSTAQILDLDALDLITP